MISMHNILTTTSFEFRRSLSVQRVGATMILALFPPTMLAIVMAGGGGEFARLATCTMVLFVGLLALLLWATPNVHGELEGRSWAYITSRQDGRFSLLFGKFLNAMIWSFLVCFAATTLCAAVVYTLFVSSDSLEIWFGITLLVLLASPVYSAIFSLIGVVFSRRSMVFGAGYILLFEFVLASMPANVNKITARFHLQVVAFELMGWFIPMFDKSEWDMLYGNTWVSVSLFALLTITVVYLGIAMAIIRWREYVTSEESI